MSDQKLSSSERSGGFASTVVAVVGPTATGKTDLAFQLAEAAIASGKWASVSLISVDSRQVYEGLEMCSGMDLPASWTEAEAFGKKCFQHPSLPICVFGVSMLLPTEEWSVANFRTYALPIIQQTLGKNGLIILVGGTGLYHEHLFSNDPHLDVPPNEEIRQRASLMSLSELQQWVQQASPLNWEKMTDSDKHNPRRLVRVLEKNDSAHQLSNVTLLSFDIQNVKHITLGITDAVEPLAERIKQRVVQRLKTGAITEIENLISQYSDEEWQLPAFSSTGCREVRQYIESQIDYDQLIELWTRREVQYAKRQRTWWKSHQAATSIEGFAKKVVFWYDLQTVSENWQTAAVESCILGE
jgi:tRNA dimethylallyltransferase